MSLYSYLLAYDSGSAPNPFHGTCTLAICKPAIRRTAQVGDWIIATGRKSSTTFRKLVYAMQVAEKIPLEDYFRATSGFRAGATLLPISKTAKHVQDWLGDQHLQAPVPTAPSPNSPGPEKRLHDPQKDLQREKTS